MTFASAASTPIGIGDLEDVLDTQGRILDQYSLRKNAFHRGLKVQDRPLLWKFFLEFYPYSTSAEERDLIDREKKDSYDKIVRSWKEKLSESSLLQDYNRLILKDVARTEKYHPYFKLPTTDSALLDILMSLVEYDSDMGYIQGMNDLLAPLLLTLQVEHEAFWCLVTIVTRRKQNFKDLTLCGPLAMLSRLCKYVDPSLYVHLEKVSQGSDWLFCYRWILLDYKREFSIDDVCSLWEAMWTCPFTGEFGMFVGVAVLTHLKDTLMTMQSFEDLMEFTSGTVQSLPLNTILLTARGLLHHLWSDEDCPHHLKVLVETTFMSPPPLVGFVRMRQSLSTRKQRITHINVWNSIFGDEPLRPIVKPLPSATPTTPPMSGFVPRTTLSWETSEDINHLYTYPSHQHTTPSFPSYQHTTPLLPSHQHTTPSLPSHQHTTPSHPSFQHTTPLLPSHQHTTPSLPSHQHTTPSHPSFQHTTPSLPSHQHTTPSYQHIAPSLPSHQHTTPSYQHIAPSLFSHQHTTPSYQHIAPSLPSHQHTTPSYQHIAPSLFSHQHTTPSYQHIAPSLFSHQHTSSHFDELRSEANLDLM